MDSSEETGMNQVDDQSDENKNEDNSLKENSVQESSSKKKFSNTNFALKMKNKRKGEKLGNLDASEVLSSCKDVSIDVTRLNSNPVSKVMNAVENKNRRRKRSQWKMGVMKKKKKSISKDIKPNPLNIGLANGVTESNHVSEDVGAVEVSKIKKEEPIHPNSEKNKQPADSESLQRRRSLRSVASSISDTSFCEPESRVNLKPEESNFSCRRIEPFIGKLTTKEARSEIANRILRGETEPKAGSSHETSENSTVQESGERITEDKDKNETEVENSLSESNVDAETNDEANKIVDEKADEKADEKDDEKDEKSTTKMDTDEKEVIHPLRKSTSKIIETKESDEPHCSRTMPFVGKTARKLPAGVPERPIEIDSSTTQKDAQSLPKDSTVDLMGSPLAGKSKLLISPKDINANAESPLEIKILSVSSLKDDEGVKEAFPPEKADPTINQAISVPVKDTHVDSDSSNKINMDSDTSVKKTRARSRLSLSKNVNLNAPMKKVEEPSDSLAEKEVTLKETRRSSAGTKRSLRSSSSMKSDSFSEDLDSKSTSPSLDETQDSWSCRRVIPFTTRKTCHLNKQLISEGASNQMEASTSVSNVSLVSSDGLIAPTEHNDEKSTSKKDQQVEENTSLKKIEDELKSKDSKKDEPVPEPTNTLDARSSTSPPALNGEWKFKRKRRILSSDDETQDKGTQKTKKTRVKKSSEAKGHIDKISVMPLPSPGKTICSFLSTKCTKHDHHSQNGQSLASKGVKAEAYVMVTRLEDMKDPEVEGFLQKTEFIKKIKKNYQRILTNKNSRDTSKSDRETTDSTSTHSIKDDLLTSSVQDAYQESDSSTSFKLSKENEDSSNQSNATSISIPPRRISSRASSGSPILHTKRKKPSVNYLEDFSDTDEEKASSSRRHLRSQQLGENALLGEPVNSGTAGILESDENDMEVEEFSRIGNQNRTETEESNKEISEQDGDGLENVNISAQESPRKTRARCKSVAEAKLTGTQRYSTRSKTPHVGMPAEKTVKALSVSGIDNKKLQADIEQGIKSMQETLNKEMEKIGLDPYGKNLTEGEKTPNSNHRVSSEKLSVSPSIPSGKSMTPKQTLGTPSEVDARNLLDTGSNTPRRSVSFQRNELLSKVTKSASQLMEADRKKEVEPRDIRVQLIRLEAVCSDYKDYSAGEIELLTDKYINMLMNSNFACDTWRKPIKFARSYNHAIDLHGPEGDFDFDSQDHEPLPFETVQVPMDSADMDSDTIAEQNITASPRRRSPKKTNKQPNDLESSIVSHSQTKSLQEKTFGAINISEVLSLPAVNVEDAEINRTLDSTVEEENDNSIGQIKDNDLILVNGTEVHACSFCNKIFVKKELLSKHVDEEHKNSEKSPATATAPAKSTEKQAPGPASSKKGKSMKWKYNESLKCTICSETYETKELLFDHIMTHNETDLQQAYEAARIAKEGSEASGLETLEKEQAKDKKQKKKPNHRKSTDSASTSVSGEELAVDVSTRTASTVNVTSKQTAISNVVVNVQGGTLNGKALTVCQCHAHELQTQDLHIEMVLLCTGCNVIYRRRDCFEVHFRTNVECRRKRANGDVTKAPKLFCSGCRCVLSSLIEMRAHLEVHAEKNCAGTVTFLCNICKVAFFGVGGIFYSHWYNHAKSPDFVASRYSFPKLSVVSVLEDVNGTMTTSKSQEGFFYIAEHVCRECRLPFSSDPELQRHKQQPCQLSQSTMPRIEPTDINRLQMIKLICDLCKKYYVNKDNFDKHCNDRNHLKTPITKFSRLPINATEQVFVCSLCRGLSKTLDEMKEHWKRVHSPIMELYTCKTCNVVPSNDVANYTYDKFEHHCRLVHKSEVITCLVYFVTARYVCNICKFGFETEKSMKEHELIHQKTTANQTAPGQMTTAPMPLVAETQTAQFYVADNLQPDGGRRLHPVVVQYSGVNGSLFSPLAISQLPNQPLIQIPGQVNAPMSTVDNQRPLTNSTVPNSIINQNISNELCKVLTNALQGQPTIFQPQQQQQQQQSNVNKVVETIELDSRSNSPVLDSQAPSTSSSSNSLSAVKKAYMTKVNPNFESILTTTNGNQTNGNGTDTPNEENSQPDDSGNAAPAEVDTLTPQPFEVVLVTDELNENPNQDKEDHLSSMTDEQPPPQPEIIETKSFLRVRSVAELQSIKIHLCSICGLNFDTPHAFEQHEKQHRGGVGRSTPVQMISPMVAPGSKETANDHHNLLMSHMKQKLILNRSNGPPASTTSTNVNIRVVPSVLPHQPVLPPQQQQSWYPTTSSSTSTMSNVNYGTSQSVQRPQQQQQQQTSVLRQAMNTPPVRNNYTSDRPPPPYPSTSNSMIAPGRTSAIQLPERSTTGNLPPQTKRPSGAATRIPQQSLPSFDEITSRQSVSSGWGYGSGSTVTYNATAQQPIIQKTYGPAPSTVNYTSMSSPVNYQSVPQSQSRQPQVQKNIIYTCKHPNCFYRSASLAGIRAHETIHLIPQQGQHSQQVSGASSNLHQQEQLQLQQQQQPQRLPVSQMPERTRHALPTGRAPNTSSNRITCRICNLNCATSIELIDHVSTVHSSANQVCCYVCDYCPSPLIFDTEEQLRRHMNVSHNHTCDICNKRWPSNEELMLHRQGHMRRT